MKALADGTAAGLSEAGREGSFRGWIGRQFRSRASAAGWSLNDFIVYGVFAQYIAKAFFPAEEPAVSSQIRSPFLPSDICRVPSAAYSSVMSAINSAAGVLSCFRWSL